MAKWTVERIDQSGINARLVRGVPRHIAEAQAQVSFTFTVEADDLSIDNGTLVFYTGGAVTHAMSPGSWSAVALAPDQA